MALGISAAGCVALLVVIVQSFRSASPSRSAEESQANVVVDASPDGLARFDEHLVCTFTSPTMADVFDRPLGALLGHRLTDWCGEDASAVLQAVHQARASAQVAEAVTRLRGTGEGCRFIEIRCAPLAGTRDLVASFRDITHRQSAELALRVANSELTRLVGSDPVTDLANRRRFEQLLELECRRASRDSTPLSLLKLAVDDFVTINDRNGAAAGDDCLRRVAAALRGMTLRPAETAARLGGEEFALLLPHADEVAVASCADRLRAALGPLATSIGYATMRPTPDTLASSRAALLAEADRRLSGERNAGTEAGTPAAPAGDGRVQPVAAGLLPLRPVSGMHQIARIAAMLLGMPTAFVLSSEPEGPVIVGQHGLEGGVLAAAWGRVAMREGVTLLVSEAEAEPDLRHAAQESGFAFLAAAPLLSGPERRAIGALWVADRQPHPSWSDSEPLLLTQLASLAAESLGARGAPDGERARDVA